MEVKNNSTISIDKVNNLVKKKKYQSFEDYLIKREKKFEKNNFKES